MAADSLKIQMGVGGFGASVGKKSLGRVVDPAYVAVFTFRGRKGALAMHRDGRIIIPSKPVSMNSIWRGVLILSRRGNCYIFKPLECIAPGVRRSGEYLITPGGAIIQTSKGAVFLEKQKSQGINFSVYASVIERFHRKIKNPSHIFATREFAELLIGDKSKLQGFKFRSDIKPKDPAKCSHKWVHVGYSNGHRLLLCRLCLQRRYTESDLQRTMDTRLLGLEDLSIGSRFTLRRRAVRRERPFWSTKGLHRRCVVHSRKSHRTRAQMKRRAKRTTKRHGTPAMWQSCRRW